MLPKSNRIPKTDFKKLFKEGRYIHSKNIILLYTRNLSIKDPQFAVIIKSKITGAVGRNKIKRMIKRILVKNINYIQKDFQIALIVKSNLEKTSQDIVKQELIYLLQKANLYKE